jgi:hypothetical protein
MICPYCQSHMDEEVIMCDVYDAISMQIDDVEEGGTKYTCPDCGHEIDEEWEEELDYEEESDY